MGNTVFLSSIEDDQLDKMLSVIRAHSEIHVQPPSSRVSEETRVSRAVIFVQDMEQLLNWLWETLLDNQWEINLVSILNINLEEGWEFSIREL